MRVGANGNGAKEAADVFRSRQNQPLSSALSKGFSMSSLRILSAACALVTVASPAIAEENRAIPDIARALLNAAYKTGEPAEIEAVRNAVVEVFPDYAEAVNADAKAQIAALAPAEPSPTVAAVTDASAPEPVKGGLFAVRPWKGKVQAGASLASGNSDNLAVGISLDAAREAGNFTHNIEGFFDIAEADNAGAGTRVVTQKRWGAAYQLDYNFSERTYSFGRFAYEEDEFSGFDYRLFAGAGLGHFLYKSEPFTWKVEGGPGFRYSPIDDTREIEQEFAARASTELDWLIREGLVFEQDVNTTWTQSTTTIQSVTALSTKLLDGLSTSIGFEFRYETDPPLGREKADQIARASLVYGF